jgi:hypothetical protein
VTLELLRLLSLEDNPFCLWLEDDEGHCANGYLVVVSFFFLHSTEEIRCPAQPTSYMAAYCFKLAYLFTKLRFIDRSRRRLHLPFWIGPLYFSFTYVKSEIQIHYYSKGNAVGTLQLCIDSMNRSFYIIRQRYYKYSYLVGVIAFLGVIAGHLRETQIHWMVNSIKCGDVSTPRRSPYCDQIGCALAGCCLVSLFQRPSCRYYEGKFMRDEE